MTTGGLAAAAWSRTGMTAFGIVMWSICAGNYHLAVVESWRCVSSACRRRTVSWYAFEFGSTNHECLKFNERRAYRSNRFLFFTTSPNVH
jgi:hypothetical protein